MGSVLSARLSDVETNPILVEFYQQRRLSETIIIPLDRRNGVVDVLELHYLFPISVAELEHLELIGPVLAGCWEGRSLGLFSDALLAGSRAIRKSQVSEEILSVENPFRLSRAEYRVCLLLSRGLNNKAVLSELSITMATLRTHLGNIYAKTGATSQSELVHMLLVSQSARNIHRIGTSDVA
ncbi:DNA-binding transcriptional regulator, CsgD family [Ruegeria marina]|uniref:DNA-binding transcriptional regulator, CsgD family n=2 Tax=Ruegeria marina TaxID=639004 RepID=A0A1G7FBD1_9RHOB|nr:DNA-binding transcriptional regulator, CsgD family [Ruegeria marina]